MPDWYQQVCLNAELAEFSQVKGCMIIRPNGYAIQEGGYMGYLEGITGGNFKKGLNGKIIFFPRGYFGRGYELPDEETYHSIKIFMKSFFIVGTLLIMFTKYSVAIVAGLKL